MTSSGLQAPAWTEPFRRRISSSLQHRSIFSSPSSTSRLYNCPTYLGCLTNALQQAWRLRAHHTAVDRQQILRLYVSFPPTISKLANCLAGPWDLLKFPGTRWRLTRTDDDNPPELRPRGPPTRSTQVRYGLMPFDLKLCENSLSGNRLTYPWRSSSSPPPSLA